MQLKTILNRVQKHQSFIYTDIKLKQDKQQLKLDISIRPRSNSRPICSGCGRKRPGYDTLLEMTLKKWIPAPALAFSSVEMTKAQILITIGIIR